MFDSIGYMFGYTTTPDDDVEDNDNRMVAASVAAGVLGGILAGPVTALVMSFGSMFVVEKDGAVGDCVRALGDVALFAKTRAMEIEKEHRIFSKLRQFVEGAANKIVRYCEQNGIFDQARRVFAHGLEWIAQKLHGGSTTGQHTYNDDKYDY